MRIAIMALPTVETIGYDYYSIFIFIHNIQILPAVSTTGTRHYKYFVPMVETIGNVL